ncbi:hypothetical protein [Clostridium manihotivorum]|uniref:Uncharacterized protein n=1 Tax=Clostridium manihotivorum TaxID=2320868 RepID=A0A410DQ95_9CLOT|nr:hypothetical protein [Clostridium manihotivorum]QAA31264.1 hypothetical protein C1I91_06165 [Clostridium manihotivorum]
MFINELDEFYNQMNNAQTIMDEMKTQNEHNQQIIDNMQKILNNVDTNQAKGYFDSFIERGKYHAPANTNIFQDKIDAIKKPLESIASFFDNLSWVITHPYATFVIVMNGLCNVVEIIAMVYCAGALLMAVMGHKKGIKYMPIGISIYVVLKLLVMAL